ncbi:hypothetical protein [Streptomyces sp. SID3343]|uniref:hypothetical protein n=1 Tax=Streptomyces sp. SID3343 TaxID=2690260 RepID=UPI001367D00B|nr:hypothetical protein [Streptomyces sp. SID3343]MYW06079.1 hypothetical protein [Streptomyces sp. SID3343]
MTWRARIGIEHQEVIDRFPENAMNHWGTLLYKLVCDPYTATVRYGEDDRIVRTAATGPLIVVLLLNERTTTLTVLQVVHLG